MLRIKHTETKANGGWGNVVSCSTSGWFRCDSGRMLIYWRFFWWMHRLIVGRREQVAVVGSRRSRVLVMLTRLVALPGSAVWANAGPPTFLLPRSEMQPHAHMIFLYLGGNVLQCSSLEWWDHPWLLDLFWGKAGVYICTCAVALFTSLQIIFNRPCMLPHECLFY